jgi:Fic family protein
MYIYQQPGWPSMHWDAARLIAPLAAVRYRQGLLLGRIHSLGFPLRSQAGLVTLTADVLKSSEIEGELLDRAQVRSSVARRLGIDLPQTKPPDRHIDGFVDLLLDATQNYSRPLTAERLKSWHAALFPTGRSGLTPIRASAWRRDADGPMQVVSGRLGKERIHYEAPPAARLSSQIKLFLEWFNAPPPGDPVCHAAQAHIWFLTLHPFEDGNGRIARALSDMALARAGNSPLRAYSMSARVRAERAAYYRILERTQKGSLDITAWMEWFLACLGRAVDDSWAALDGILAKARFWRAAAAHSLNDRQRLVCNRLLDGFTGALSTSKYARLAKCSPDTALRDIEALLDAGLFIRNPGGGRSTSYSLVQFPEEL